MNNWDKEPINYVPLQILLNYMDRKHNHIEMQRKSFVELLLDYSAKNGNKTALVDCQSSLTFRELDECSAKLAHYLLSQGVNSSEWVCVSLPRRKEFVISILAIMRIGAGYVPIDTNYPKDRKEYIIKDSEAKVVITEDFLKAAEQSDAQCDSINLCTPDSPAYMIYTSGSTGKPKAVVTRQKSLTALLTWKPLYFGYRPENKHLAVSSFSFVASIHDLIVPISTGATVHIIESALAKDIDGLHQYIIDNHIDRVFASTPVGSLLINAYPDMPIESIAMGGAKMGVVAKTNAKIFNVYGSTETTTTVLCHIVDQDNDTQIPLGKAVPGVQVFICDENGNQVPNGEEGELCICSEQLADGYWKQEDLTKEKFVLCPFTEAKGAIMYKTGDKVRCKPNGDIEYISRIDNQVKLRGKRVELEEIEIVAAQYPGITACIAAVFGSHLCLYYLAEEKLDNEDIKNYLSKILTDYMIPNVIIQIDKIPLNYNGKPDRKALPNIIEFREDIIDPESEEEKLVYSLVQPLVDCANFGVINNLISLGLDSLSAMSLSVEISKCSDYQIKAIDIINYPTVREIAAHLTKKELRSAHTEQDSYPLSDNQKPLFLDWELNKESTKYNLPTIHKYEGIKAEELRNAILKVVEAHPTIKRSFQKIDGEIVQVPRISAPTIVEIINLDTEPSQDYFKQFIKPFNLLGGDLYHFFVCCHNDTSYLFYDIHHSAFDGISSVIFERDIQKALAGEELHKEIYTAFDMAIDEKEWQKGANSKKSEKYFNELFDKVESYEYPHSAKPDSDTPQSASLKIELPSDDIKTYCSENGFTINSFFITILSELLLRFSREQDLVISTIDNGRNEQFSESIGMFVKDLPFVCKSSNKDTLFDVISKTQKQLVETKSNELYQHSISPIPGVMFAYQGGIDTILNSYALATDIAIFPLNILVYPKEENFIIHLSYDASLYNRNDIATLGESFKSLSLNSISQYYTDIKDIPIVSNETKEQLIALSKGEDLEYNAAETIVDMEIRNAKERPDSIALVDTNGTLTYAELIEASNDIAQYLINLSVKPNDFVCIKLQRSKDLLIYGLAIMRIGAAYVPIDLSYPIERQKFMIADSQAKLVIDEEFVEKYNKSGVKATECINRATPENRAYMIYTSGSTGTPKGVIIKHKSLRAYVAWRIVKNEISPNSRHLLHSSFSFDASIDDISCPLAAGASVYVLDEEGRKDLHHLYNYIVDNKITNALLSTQLGMMLVNNYPDLPLHFLTIGGEKMLPVKKTNVKLINAYGPTEFTVASSFHIVDSEKDGENIPIGRPAPNSYSFICDPQGYLVPQGVVGELMLCGAQISEGYWMREKLTQEKFIPCPFVPGEKMYHTGDLARYNEDGNLEYCGRIDKQVKLHGFRIEPGEIESLAASFKGVHNALALVVDGKLVLYYTSVDDLDKQALRDYLASKLADYMVPATFVHLASMPLTGNGKIDIKMLPKPRFDQIEEIVEPQSDLEKLLYNLVSDTLGTKDFGITTNLISMGLDSLSAMSISAKLFKQNGMDLPTNIIFKYHTIREWAEHLVVTETHSSTKGSYPLCDNQIRLYQEWELHRNSIQYNVPSLRKYEGVDAEKLKSAVIAFLQAHPYLKTHFAVVDDNIVQLRLDDETEIISIAELPGGDLNEFFQSRVKSFDLMAGPLYRIEIYKSEGGCYLFSDFHHSIFDGLSNTLFYNDIDTVLRGGKLNKESYTSFDHAIFESEWQNSADYHKASNYYDSTLAGVAVASLDHSLEPDSEIPGKLAKCSLKVESGDIDHFCQHYSITPNSYFITVLANILHRISREDKLLFSFINSGRNNAAVYNTAGMFVKTLPLVSKKSWNNIETFSGAAKAIQDSLAETITYNNYPYSKILSKLDRHPEICFVFEGGITNLTDNDFNLSLDVAKMPLSIIVTPTNDSYTIDFEYDASLYNKKDISLLVDCYDAYIHSSLKNQALHKIELVSLDYRHKLLELSKGEDLPYNEKETFVDMVLHQAKLRPEAIAVVDCQSSISYKELDEQSNRLAYYLIEKGVGIDDFVCIGLKRRKEFLVAVLAVLRAGAAYVPIDLDIPQQRKDFIISDSNSKLFIDEEFVNKALSQTAPEALSINYSSPKRRAYMIYTSGSTGNPKGVIISCKAFRAFLAWRIHALNITSESRHLSHINLCFDASADDLYCPLAAGGCVFILKEDMRTDLAGMYNYIVDNQITHSSFSTQLGTMLVEAYPDIPLQYISMGGEKMQAMPKIKAKIINEYGPSEFTVASSYHIVNQDIDKEIPIGRPVPNSYSFICDRYGQLLPQGYVGELCLLGAQIAEGYNKLPHKTKEHFVPCPFLPKHKMYRTGDLCRYNEKGELEFIGRVDSQVKLRGFRIELSEIDTVASIFYGVQTTAACIKTIGSGKQELCLYFTAHTEIDTKKFKEFLSQRLPEYMIPSCFVQLDRMPSTHNGKIDFKALPNPTDFRKREGRMATSKHERFFVKIFMEILGLPKVYADDNFFEIGGSSLLAMRIVIAAEKEGFKLAYADVFECKTPEKLAAHCEKSETKVTEAKVDLSDYDYTAINNLLKNNSLENFLTKEQQSFKNVLLLGSTGFLGVHLLNQLLTHYNDTHIYCLVRKSSAESVKSRLQNIYSYYYDTSHIELYSDRITVIAGDISNRLDFENFKNYPIDLVINAAANVKHFAEGDEIYKTNFSSVLNIIEFCNLHKARLVHVSTISVSGFFNDSISMDYLYRENDLYKGQIQLSKYTLSKYLAERAILQAVADGKIEAKIMRVGNLSPRESDGKYQVNASSNSFMSRIKGSYIIGQHPYIYEYMELELSPIDLVAKAILLLTNTPKENVVFHPVNNNQMVMGDLYDCMNAEKLTSKAVSVDVYTKSIEAAKDNPEIASILTSMLAYNFSDNTNYLPLRTVSNFTQRVLAYLSFSWPYLGSEYMIQFLKILKQIGFFKV